MRRQWWLDDDYHEYDDDNDYDNDDDNDYNNDNDDDDDDDEGMLGLPHGLHAWLMGDDGESSAGQIAPCISFCPYFILNFIKFF